MHEIKVASSGELTLVKRARGVIGGVIITFGITHSILCHGNGIFAIFNFAAPSTVVFVKNNSVSFITTHAAETINSPVMAIFIALIPSFRSPGFGPESIILNPPTAITKTASVGAIIQARKFSIF